VNPRDLRRCILGTAKAATSVAIKGIASHASGVT
jgi:hypothetical protein